eukprot:gene16536-11829_t
MSKGRSRLLSNFEVRHLSHTITEYVASVEGRPFFSRLWWQHIFLRHRIIFTLLVMLYLVGICTSMARREWWLAAFFSAAFLVVNGLILHNLAIEESVTIIQQFGLQLKRTYFFGREKIQFIERERLHGVFIHEFIKGCQVRFGLAFELKSRPSTTVSSQALHANAAKSGNNSPPHLSNAPHAAGDSTNPQSNSAAPPAATSLVVLFQEVYPGFDALKKVYRSCSVETDH